MNNKELIELIKNECKANNIIFKMIENIFVNNSDVWAIYDIDGNKISSENTLLFWREVYFNNELLDHCH